MYVIFFFLTSFFLLQEQEQDQVYDLAEILSIESSGLQDNHLNVTVRYQGNENCYLEWFLGQYFSDSQLRKGNFYL